MAATISMHMNTSARDMASAARRASGVGVSPSKLAPRHVRTCSGSRSQRLGWRASAQARGSTALDWEGEFAGHTKCCDQRQLTVSADNRFVSFTRSPRVRLPEETIKEFSFNKEKTMNVLGLGQAMVDFAASVEPSVLESMRDAVPDLEYGGRACVDAETRGEVLTKLDGQSYKLSAGGSLSNTLVALSRLSSARELRGNAQEVVEEETEQTVDVAIACSLGPDPLGEFFRTKVKKAGVQVLSEPGEGGTTGSVIVLTTPDAQRTMMSCWGTSAQLPYDDALDQAVAAADILVVEGYLWEMPETIVSIKRALVTAKRNGVTVALSASDQSCVEKHRDEFWELLRAGDVDVFFANMSEALAMTKLTETHAREAVVELAQHAKLVAVTDGSKGSYLVKDGGDSFAHVPPHWLSDKPVDTCGAGDAYAAGCLYGILHGRSLHDIGKMGARVASVVISHTGARLGPSDAEMLMGEKLFQPMTDEEEFNQPALATGMGDQNWDHLNQLIKDLRNKEE